MENIPKQNYCIDRHVEFTNKPQFVIVIRSLILLVLTHPYKLHLHFFCSYPENGVVQLQGKDVRPRARTIYQWHQLEEGMVVMVNYNPDEPKERGYWYDAQIQRKRETRTQREIFGKILLG